MKRFIVLLLVILVLGLAFKTTKRASTRLVDTAPVSVTARPGIISAGPYHIAAISAGGDIYGWGDNKSKELGLMDVAQVPVPTRLTAETKWRHVYTGSNASYAISATGELFRRGTERTEAYSRSAGVRSRYANNTSYAITATGEAYPSGYERSDPNSRSAGEQSRYAYKIISTRTQWRKVMEAHGVGAGLDEQNKLWIWNDRSVEADMPTLVYPLRVWVDFCITKGKIYGVTEDGGLWRAADSTGRSSSISSAQNMMDFAMIGVPAKMRRVYCQEHSEQLLAIDTDDRLWGFGTNQYGELGTRGAVRETDMRKLNDKRWIDVALGPSFVVAIDGQGALWAWGSNQNGQLGVGDTRGRDNATPLNTGHIWVAVVAGHNFAAGVTRDGELFTWGGNTHGALGEGGAAGLRNSPTKVYGDKRWGISSGVASHASP